MTSSMDGYKQHEIGRIGCNDYTHKQQKMAINDKDLSLLVEIDLHKRVNHAEIVEALSKLEAVHYIEEIH